MREKTPENPPNKFQLIVGLFQKSLRLNSRVSEGDDSTQFTKTSGILQAKPALKPWFSVMTSYQISMFYYWDCMMDHRK